MPALAKASLLELDEKFENEASPPKRVTVQFNPESLKVSFANQVATPNGAGDQNGSAPQLFVGAGSTKLALQIWFDLSSLPSGDTSVTDVRDLTKEVAYFITPHEKDTPQGKKYVPPAVRFLWGSFMFDGIMESMEESLELFSPEGKPIRASVSFNLTRQQIQFQFAPQGGANGPGGAGPPPGTQPLTPAPSGSTVQGMAASQGRGADWQNIASANGIENPRQLQPGQLIDLNARR
jgi:Contractile injection system tube protein/LysM domain